jgi:hypothetical protein
MPSGWTGGYTVRADTASCALWPKIASGAVVDQDAMSLEMHVFVWAGHACPRLLQTNTETSLPRKPLNAHSSNCHRSLQQVYSPDLLTVLALAWATKSPSKPVLHKIGDSETLAGTLRSFETQTSILSDGIVFVRLKKLPAMGLSVCPFTIFHSRART